MQDLSRRYARLSLIIRTQSSKHFKPQRVATKKQWEWSLVGYQKPYVHLQKCLVKTTKNLVIHNQACWLIWHLPNVWYKPTKLPYQTFLVGFQPNIFVAVFGWYGIYQTFGKPQHSDYLVFRISLSVWVIWIHAYTIHITLACVYEGFKLRNFQDISLFLWLVGS
jgi:hypothetical protein